MVEITTIKLTKKTKSRLNKLRSFPRESYEEILQNILEILNICRIDPEKALDKLLEITPEDTKVYQKEQSQVKKETTQIQQKNKSIPANLKISKSSDLPQSH